MHITCKASVLDVSHDVATIEMSLWPDGKIRNDNTPEWVCCRPWGHYSPIVGNLEGFGKVTVNIHTDLRKGDILCIEPGDLVLTATDTNDQ